jgi:2-iminobutanoate/2-iminopropanoate deaminase
MKIARVAALALFGVAGFAQAAGHADKPQVEYLTSEATTKQNLPFSEAVRVGHVLYLSGMLGVTPGTMKVVDGGLEAETKQILDNMTAVLERNGSSMDNVFKCTVMIKDMSLWPKMNAIYVTYFKKHLPARSAMGVAALAVGAQLEIECMATVN